MFQLLDNTGYNMQSYLWLQDYQIQFLNYNIIKTHHQSYFISINSFYIN